MKTDKDIAEAAKIAFRYSGGYAASFILQYEKLSEKKKSIEKIHPGKKFSFLYWLHIKFKNGIQRKALFRKMLTKTR